MALLIIGKQPWASHPNWQPLFLAAEKGDLLQRIENSSNVSDEILQKLKIQIDLDQKNVSELENQNSEFSAIMESINLDLKVKNI